MLTRPGLYTAPEFHLVRYISDLRQIDEDNKKMNPDNKKTWRGRDLFWLARKGESACWLPEGSTQKRFAAQISDISDYVRVQRSSYREFEINKDLWLLKLG